MRSALSQRLPTLLGDYIHGQGHGTCRGTEIPGLGLLSLPQCRQLAPQPLGKHLLWAHGRLCTLVWRLPCTAVVEQRGLGTTKLDQLRTSPISGGEVHEMLAYLDLYFFSALA